MLCASKEGSDESAPLHSLVKDLAARKFHQYKHLNLRLIYVSLSSNDIVLMSFLLEINSLQH